MILGLFFMMCFIAIVVISIGTSIIQAILHAILAFFGRIGHPHGQPKQTQSSRQSQSQQSSPSGGKKRDKIFDKSDGEYVDFEEIKE
jgi:MFS superfamily sulfate permease-like transporter